MKPGYRTTEFWLALVSIVWPQVASGVDPTTAAGIGGLAAGAYAIARGLAKLNVIRGSVGHELGREDLGRGGR